MNVHISTTNCAKMVKEFACKVLQNMQNLTLMIHLPLPSVFIMNSYARSHDVTSCKHMPPHAHPESHIAPANLVHTLLHCDAIPM